jgi:NADH-quinone oxidoreductase subunit N
VRPQGAIAVVGCAVAGLAILLGWVPQGLAFGQTVTLADGETVATGFLRVDGFGLYAQGTVLVAGLVVGLLALAWLARGGRRRGELFVLLLLAVAGMLLLTVANDLVLVFIGIETFSICLYVLAGFQRDRRDGQEAALKYFILGAFAAGFLLYGTALVYASTGTTNLDALAAYLDGRVASLPAVTYAGVALLLGGLAFKIALVPFHQWTPDVYEGAPLPVTAFMASATKVAAFAALFRVLWTAFPALAGLWQPLLAALAVLTMVVGNLGALMQADLKRMLAFASVAQAGYLAVAVVSGPPAGAWAMLFYLLQYTLATVGVFGVLIGLGRVAPSGREATSLSDLAGLGRRHAGLALALAVFLFSFTGLPPTLGFLGKWYVFQAAVGSGWTWLAAVLVLASVLSAFYYLRPVVLMYMAGGPEERTIDVPTPAAVSVAAAATVVGLALLLAGPLVGGAEAAALAGQPQPVPAGPALFISGPSLEGSP